MQKSLQKSLQSYPQDVRSTLLAPFMPHLQQPELYRLVGYGKRGLRWTVTALDFETGLATITAPDEKPRQVDPRNLEWGPLKGPHAPLDRRPWTPQEYVGRLIEVAEKIDWVQGRMFQGNNRSPQAACLLGYMNVVTHETKRRGNQTANYQTEQVVRERLLEVIGAHSIPQWNDSKERTREEVMAALFALYEKITGDVHPRSPLVKGEMEEKASEWVEALDLKDLTLLQEIGEQEIEDQELVSV